MPATLLRLLLCVVLVLNGIGAATAGAGVADRHAGPAVPAEVAGEPMPDCPHAAASPASGHAPPADPLPSPGHAGHEGDECLELCLEQCLNQGHAMVALQPGLPSRVAALMLASRDDLRLPMPVPALPTRPPIA